ncbi:MAG: ubiquinone/menaquinone biosynthesis methyltransferase [Coriobacteriia bacterium]|nr:ubiquinone/menaquinone biosynthesis methyltransferase [Coriobacteriia bacterium]
MPDTLPKTPETPDAPDAPDAHDALDIHDIRANDESLTPEAKQERVYEVFQQISGDYDRMNRIISAGRQDAWKRALISRVASVHPRVVLDVASGTGDIALQLARALPHARIVASDFSENMLAVAERRIEAAGVATIEISCQNAMQMSFLDASFDAVTISFGLRNMPDYQQVVAQCVRVLRPAGLFACLDASYPTNALVRPFFRLYFAHLMPWIGRVFAKAPAEYQWLADSTEAFLTKDELAQLMQDCGLGAVSYRSFMLGGAALHTGVKGVSVVATAPARQRSVVTAPVGAGAASSVTALLCEGT